MFVKDEQAIIKRIFHLFRRAIYDFAFSQVDSAEDAEDVAQQACLKALKKYREKGLPGFIGSDTDNFEVLRQSFRLFGNLDLERIRSRVSDEDSYQDSCFDEPEYLRERFDSIRPISSREYLDLSIIDKIRKERLGIGEGTRTPLDELIEREDLEALESDISRILPIEVRKALEAHYSYDEVHENFHYHQERALPGKRRRWELGINNTTYDRRVKKGKEILARSLLSRKESRDESVSSKRVVV